MTLSLHLIMLLGLSGPEADDTARAAEATQLTREAIQLQQQGKTAAATLKAQQALDIRRQFHSASTHPDGHTDLAASLNNLGYLLQQAGRHDQTLPNCEQALAMRDKLFPVEQFPNGHWTGTSALTLTKSSDTPVALAWGRKKARYAHIGTHVYFDAAPIAADNRLWAAFVLSGSGK